MSKKVCRNCFADLQLREFVNTHGAITSRCEWCESTDVPAVGTTALGEAFRRLADLYVPTGSPIDGDPIEFLIQEDWEPFVDRIADDSEKLRSLVLMLLCSDLSAKELSEDIDFESGFTRESDSLTDNWTTEVNEFLEHWTAESGVRSSLTSIAADSQLAAALEDLAEVYSATSRLCRARIHRDRARTERFELDDLAAPPPDRAESGRANRKGHPVLYLASDSATAVAEVRGWVGMAIAVAEVRLRQDARLVDLRKRPPIDRPFFEVRQ